MALVKYFLKARALRKPTIVVLCCGLLLAGCASSPTEHVSFPPLAGIETKPIETVDLLAVSPEMQAFVDAQITPRSSSLTKLRALVYAIDHPGLLGYEYDALGTYSGSESFYQRSGNCVAFSNMLIAMARAAGLKASYQESMLPPSWSERSDITLLNMHLNVRVKIGGYDYTVDVARGEVNDQRDSHVISDASGRAHYYNNRGVDALFNDNLGLAYSYFRAGIDADPQLSFLWSNLGIVYRRADQDDDALWAYRKALEFNPEDHTAMNNLAKMYSEQGRVEESVALSKKADALRLKNPYYLLLLSEDAMNEGRYEDAQGLLIRALRRKDNEYRLHFAMARALYNLESFVAAERSYRKARKLAPRRIAKSDFSESLAQVMASLAEEKVP